MNKLEKDITIGVFISALLFFWLSLFQGNALVERFRNAADSVVVDALGLEAKKEYNFGGFLVRGESYRATNTEHESPIPSAYLSRYGFQFRIFDMIRPAGLSLETYVAAIQLFMVLLFSATLSLLTLVLRKELGSLPALGVFASVLSSPWLILYSGSITWAIFASFLPFVLSWTLYERLRSRLWAFCLVAGFLVFFKALFGYEYLSNIVLSALVPLIYYEVRRQSSWLRIAKKAALVFFAGVLGFFGVLILHIYQGAAYLGSRAAIVQHLIGKELQRATGEFSSTSQIFSDYLFGPAYLKTSFLAHVLLTAAYLWTTGIFLLGIALLIFSWFTYQENIRARPAGQLTALFFATAFSYVASISWAVLMPSAMATHPQLSSIIFYLPANLMVVVFFFYMLAKRWHGRI